MSDAFTLDPRIADTTIEVADWPLSHLLLKDDARFHWLLLVPRRPAIRELTDLAPADYAMLSQEILAATRLMLTVSRPDKVNVATLGNLVPQMHVHVVGRFASDAAWPGPVWSAGDGPGFAPHALLSLRDRYAKAAAALEPR
jgi:diadenosine tetraphosphate (Ap4A) HIT family hydrolase